MDTQLIVLNNNMEMGTAKEGHCVSLEQIWSIPEKSQRVTCVII